MRVIKIIPVLAFILFSCANTRDQRHKIDKIFNNEQTEDLQKIVNFFSEQMCGSGFTFENCMEKSLAELVESGWQPILKNVDFDEQLKLYDKLNSSIFGEVWAYCKTSDPGAGREKKSICYQQNGRYNDFLFKIGQENPIIEAYHQDLIKSGDFVGITRLEKEIHNNTGKIKIDDPNIQIILSIHYLSQNDQQKRKEIWSDN